MVGSIVVESLARQYPGRFAVDVMGVYSEAIFAHCPHITRVNRKTQPIRLEQPLIHQSHNGHTFAFAMCHHVGQQLGVELLPQTNRPILYFTDHEKLARPLKEPYCLVNAGYKDDCQLKWYSRWQEVVLQLHKTYPGLKVVQVGESFHHHPALKGENVVNMIGRMDGNGRKLMTWSLHSEFGLGPISFLMHVFAAVEKPYVCLATGREPLNWACNYPRQRYVGRHACLPCSNCWRNSWLECPRMVGDKTPACLDIPATKVMQEIENFVKGGLITLPVAQ